MTGVPNPLPTYFFRRTIPLFQITAISFLLILFFVLKSGTHRVVLLVDIYRAFQEERGPTNTLQALVSIA